jgi:hypothetical protein
MNASGVEGVTGRESEASAIESERDEIELPGRRRFELTTGREEALGR